MTPVYRLKYRDRVLLRPYRGLLTAFCRNPFCKHFGRDLVSARSPHRVTFDGGRRHFGEAFDIDTDGNLTCMGCGAQFALHSPRAAFSEYLRLLRKQRIQRAPACTNRKCRNAGFPIDRYPLLYAFHSQNNLGRARYICRHLRPFPWAETQMQDDNGRGCATTISTPANRFGRNDADQTVLILKCILNKTPMRGVMRILDISMDAVVSAITLLHDQVMLWNQFVETPALERIDDLSHGVQRAPGMKLLTDVQYFSVNKRSRIEIPLSVGSVTTCCGRTGYVLRADLCYDPDVDPDRVAAMKSYDKSRVRAYEIAENLEDIDRQEAGLIPDAPQPEDADPAYDIKDVGPKERDKSKPNTVPYDKRNPCHEVHGRFAHLPDPKQPKPESPPQTQASAASGPVTEKSMKDYFEEDSDAMPMPTFRIRRKDYVPRDGAQVVVTYTAIAHFRLIDETLKAVKRIDFIMDGDPALKPAIMIALRERIRRRDTEVLTLSFTKGAERDKIDAINTKAEGDLVDYAKEIKVRNRREAIRRQIEQSVKAMAEKAAAAKARRERLPKADRTIRHPEPHLTEPNRSFICHTNYGEHDAARLVDLIQYGSSLRLDAFAAACRRRISLLERAVAAHNGGGSFFGYTAYNPGRVAQLLESFRTYYNWCEKREDGKTPAERLGLRKGVVSLEELLSFDPWERRILDGHTRAWIRPPWK